MGFFSRLFGMDTKDGAASASEDTGSELALDEKTAAKVLAEIDIDVAISAHENWKLRLQNYLDGRSKEDLRPDVICQDDKCDLGKWLHGAGRQQLGKYPSFTVLVARHKYFHVEASNVVAHAQAGNQDEARRVLDSTYRHASTQVVLMLKALKRGLQGR